MKSSKHLKDVEKISQSPNLPLESCLRILRNSEVLEEFLSQTKVTKLNETIHRCTTSYSLAKF